MNRPLRLEAILARVLGDRCPGVQACPHDSALGYGTTTPGPSQDPSPLIAGQRWELWRVVPNAPRTWAGMGSPFAGSALRHELCRAAERALGFAVTLDRGEADQVWVVPATPKPTDQEQSP